jgi:transposase-like protein
MTDDHIEGQGQQLRDELDRERRKAGGDHRWRCSSDVRERVVAYAVACSADGESHGRVAERLGVGQGTLSRWIRRRRQAKGSVRPVAIVPAQGRHAAPPVARAPLRLVSPHGYVIEGLEPELPVSILQVLG